MRLRLSFLQLFVLFVQSKSQSRNGGAGGGRDDARNSRRHTAAHSHPRMPGFRVYPGFGRGTVELFYKSRRVREIFDLPRQEGVHSVYECIELSEQGTKCTFRLKIRDVNEVNIFSAKNCRAHKMKCASISQDMRGVYKRIGKHSHKLDNQIFYDACVRAHMYEAVQVDLDKDLKEVCDDVRRRHRYICCS
jgi:hypothetical protein